MDQLTHGIVVAKDCSNIDTLPRITFSFDDIDYVLDPTDYVLQVSMFGYSQCVLGIMGAKFPKGFNYYILGDIFMRRYYTYFDKNQDRLGFIDSAKLKGSEQEVLVQ